MMTTALHHDGHDIYVGLYLHGEQVDLAGPFDDRADAELAAQRIAPAAVDYELDGGWAPVSWSGGRYMSRRERRLAERKAAGAA